MTHWSWSRELSVSGASLIKSQFAGEERLDNINAFINVMAARTNISSIRPVLEILRPTRSPPRPAVNSSSPSRIKPPASARNVSTAAPQRSEMEVDRELRPRWSYTPPAMLAPVRSRPPRREEPWKVNDDPLMLDSFYIRFCGPGGEKLLTEDTKWLAVTHKSFDHGRRGFNDRLSYIGGMAVTRYLLEMRI